MATAPPLRPPPTDAQRLAADRRLHNRTPGAGCRFDPGAAVVINAPPYTGLPAGAEATVEAADDGPPPLYTLRLSGTVDACQVEACCPSVSQAFSLCAN